MTAQALQSWAQNEGGRRDGGQEPLMFSDSVLGNV
jgi:hypothetical protein